MALGLRSLLALIALRPRRAPVPMANALEACAPGIDAETLARVDPKGRQAPAPFEIALEHGDEGTYVVPKSADPHRHA
jgi:hypothetical protein